MASFQMETGIDFLSRVGKKQNISKLCPHFFSGNVKSSDVIEIYGPSGSGKSMICLDIIIDAILPESWSNISIGGLDTGAILIDCDGHFNILHFYNMIERKLNKIFYLHQMSDESEEKVSKAQFKQGLEELMKSCLTKLTVVECPSSHSFNITLMTFDKPILDKADVSLVIVDSLSSFYWYDRAYRFQSWTSMENHMDQIVNRFLRITKDNHILTIATINELFSKSKVKEENSPDTYHFLGKEWNNKVTTRITSQLKHTTSNKNECCVTVKTKDNERVSSYSFHEDGIHPLLS